MYVSVSHCRCYSHDSRQGFVALCSDVSQECVNADTIVSPLERYNGVLSLLLNKVWKCFTYTSQCSPGMDRKKHSLVVSEITVVNKCLMIQLPTFILLGGELSFLVLKQSQSFLTVFNTPSHIHFSVCKQKINLLKPTGYMMHKQV
jgi:hypothetical protein